MLLKKRHLTELNSQVYYQNTQNTKVSNALDILFSEVLLLIKDTAFLNAHNSVWFFVVIGIYLFVCPCVVQAMTNTKILKFQLRIILKKEPRYI